MLNDDGIITNFVHDDANSDDVVSDEELELIVEDLEQALTTRIGGREKTKEDDAEDAWDVHTGRETWWGGGGRPF